MKLGETKTLFHPGFEDNHSDTFEVSVGGQTTLVAMGLMPGEKVEVELVLVPAIQPNVCACVPYAAELPSVAATAPLNCCDGRVTLDSCRSFVVLNAPQGVRMRAIATTGDNTSLWVWAIGTATPMPSEYMQGCGDCNCETPEGETTD